VWGFQYLNISCIEKSLGEIHVNWPMV
jgi:hypothetical protein